MGKLLTGLGGGGPTHRYRSGELLTGLRGGGAECSCLQLSAQPASAPPVGVPAGTFAPKLKQQRNKSDIDPTPHNKH